MKEDHNLIDGLVKRITEFGQANIELIKLRIIDKTISIISALFPDLIVGTLLAIFLFFLNLGLAFWLGNLLGKIYFGFLALSLVYLMLGFAAHFFMRRWFKKVAAQYLIKQFFRQ
jgi:hypothetical protein